MRIFSWLIIIFSVGLLLRYSSELSLWLIALIAAVVALLLQPLCASSLDRLKDLYNRRKPPEDIQQSLAPETFVENQDFDLSETPPCPHCGATNVAKVIYGKPALTRKILEGMDAGTIISGGCMIHDGAPEWYCHSCRKDFGHLKFDLAATEVRK